MYARGMSVREIQAFLAESYGSLSHHWVLGSRFGR